MDKIDVTLTLPAELVSRAKEAGVLDNLHIARLIEAELRRRNAAAKLGADVVKLRAASEPMSDDEIAALVNAEIEAYRAEKRSKT